MAKAIKNKSTQNSGLILAYNNLITSKKISVDAAQEKVVGELALLQQDFETYHKTRNGLLCRILKRGKDKKPKGLYIFGGVGRGKSMLMDLFMQTMDAEIPARRVHFYAFMSEIHTRIKDWRDKELSGKKPDVIKFIAAEIAKDTALLCFDEMQISDIADAMIIGRLFSSLFENGVVIVATSNREPDALYKDGLQRERFVPFIELFKKEMKLVELKSKVDYRLQHISNLSQTYFTPLGAAADKFIDGAYNELAGGFAKPKTIEVRGRKINALKSSGGVALFTFAELCDANLGSEDYIGVACQFSTIILSNIPKMKKDDYNLAIRFMKLVDELYEHKCKLICTAEVAASELYIEGEQSFEFQRTVSRLIEMQSQQYLEAEHKS